MLIKTVNRVKLLKNWNRGVLSMFNSKMKNEYDFTNGERGKFYHPEAKIKPPMNRQINQEPLEITAFSNHSANTIDEWLDDKEDVVWK